MHDRKAEDTVRLAGHAVAAGVFLAWPVSFAATCLLTLGMPWSGEGLMQTLAPFLVLVPAVAAFAAGVVVTALGVAHRCVSAVAAGSFAVVAAFGITAISGIQAIMAGIL